MSFAMGRATYPTRIMGKTKANIFKLRSGEIICPDIDIYLTSNNPKASDRKVRRSDFTFIYYDIIDDFEQIINKWFEQKELLEPVLNLYFSNIYNTKQYLTTKFLNLIQALESFHRRIYNGKYIDDDEFVTVYDGLLKNIPESVSKDFFESLKSKLEHLHEYSLQKRIKDILNSCKPYHELILDDKKSFIEDVKNTRNYLTHYDEKLKSKAKTSADLYVLNIQLRLVLELCILIQLGTKLNIENILKSHSEYRQLRYMINQKTSQSAH